MRRVFLLLIILFALIRSHLTHPRTGCLANSQELAQPFDTKAYHLVACTCDCTYHQAMGKYSPSRNQCLECYHFHDPRPLIFVTKIIKTTMEYPRTNIQDARYALQLLINRYREKIIR